MVTCAALSSSTRSIEVLISMRKNSVPSETLLLTSVTVRQIGSRELVEVKTSSGSIIALKSDPAVHGQKQEKKQIILKFYDKLIDLLIALVLSGS